MEVMMRRLDCMTVVNVGYLNVVRGYWWDCAGGIGGVRRRSSRLFCRMVQEP